MSEAEQSRGHNVDGDSRLYAHLLDLRWHELWIIDVGLDRFDDRFGDVFLVILEQTVKKLLGVA